MEQNITALVAAMPEEIKPLLKLAGRYEKSVLDGFNLYRFDMHGKPCTLIESGIGMARAGKAVEALVARERPVIIISFGFGGAARPGMTVGDLAIAGSSLTFREGGPDEREAIVLPTPSQLQKVLDNICRALGCTCRRGEFLTSDKILNKQELASALPPEMVNPVLDMETWAVSRIAARENIPLLAIRAISDAADEELDFSLDRFTDREMNIRIHKILWAIARQPRIVPQLLRLAKNSRISGRNLAAAVSGLLETDMTQQHRWEPPRHRAAAAD